MTEVKWRRRWKPTIEAQPWRFVCGVRGFPDGKCLLMKTRFSDDSYEIFVSDMEQIWYEEMEGRSILKKNKKLNANVEAPLDKLLDHIKDQTDQTQPNMSFREDDEDRVIILTLNTTLADLPFVWKYKCVLKAEDVSGQLCLPLLTMVDELVRQQQVLIQQLKAKDTELDDLRAQGVHSSRKHLETGPFQETIFNNAMVTSQDFEKSVKNEGRHAFGEIGSRLYRDIMTKKAWLNCAPQNNDDNSSGDDEAVGESWAHRVPPSLAPQSVSPSKNSTKASSSKETTPIKDSELLRRGALVKRLADKLEKKDGQKKKKKKLKL